MAQGLVQSLGLALEQGSRQEFWCLQALVQELALLQALAQGLGLVQELALTLPQVPFHALGQELAQGLDLEHGLGLALEQVLAQVPWHHVGIISGSI